MVFFAVSTFKNMRTWLSFYTGQSIGILILFAISCLLSVMFGKMCFIALCTSGYIRVTTKCRMSLFLTVLVLWNVGICIHTINSGDISSNIELLVDNVLSSWSTLQVPDVNLNYYYIQFEWKISGVMGPCSTMYRSLMIFKYDLDSDLISLTFLIHFSIIFKLEVLASLSVVIITLSLMIWMKSAVMSDLNSFRLLLVLAICWLAELIINSAFYFAIRIIICFLDGSLVIMLILGFFCLLLLFLALIIFVTLSANKVGNTFLIHKTSSTFGQMLAFKACIYNFLILEGFGAFLLIELTLLSEEGIAKDNGITDSNWISFGVKVFGLDPKICSESMDFGFGVNWIIIFFAKEIDCLSLIGNWSHSNL